MTMQGTRPTPAGWLAHNEQTKAKLDAERRHFFDWRTRLATGDLKPLPQHMSWLHPGAGETS